MKKYLLIIVISTYLTIIPSCTRLYFGPSNVQKFSTVQPDELGQVVSIWEDGLRTTLVISAPGFTSPNSRSDRVVSLLDIYPTLVDLAGLKPREELDGQSLVPLIKEPKLPWPRAVVSTYGYQNHSVRTERWRYIRYYDGTEELYDHHKDPHEWNNLAAHSVTKNYRSVINRLKKSLPTINARPWNVN